MDVRLLSDIHNIVYLLLQSYQDEDAAPKIISIDNIRISIFEYIILFSWDDE